MPAISFTSTPNPPLRLPESGRLSASPPPCHRLLPPLHGRTAGQLLGNPAYRDSLLDFLDHTGRFLRLLQAPEAEKKDRE
ncbi:Pre-mRNA-splicing helicase BRR2 [Rhodotorula toruloides]